MSLRMPVSVGVIVRMRVQMWSGLRMNLVLAKDLLSEGVVLGKRFVMPVSVSAAVRSAFGLERRSFRTHPHAKLQKHLLQNGISFKLKMVFRQFDGDVPVSQVVSGPHQGEGRFSSHQEDILWR